MPSILTNTQKWGWKARDLDLFFYLGEPKRSIVWCWANHSISEPSDFVFRKTGQDICFPCDGVKEGAVSAGASTMQYGKVITRISHAWERDPGGQI